MTTTGERLVITCVWGGGLLASVACALCYLLVRDGTEVPLLVWHDVVDVLKSVLAVYGAYLGGIIAFWFAKPFTPKRSPAHDRIRFWIALSGAVVVNLAFLGWMSIGYWSSSARLEDILAAKNAMIWLAFVVAPANLYFFGVRASQSRR